MFDYALFHRSSSVSSFDYFHIIDQKNNLYAYSPENAIDYPWNVMTSQGARIAIDSKNIILLKPISGMIITPLGEA